MVGLKLYHAVGEPDSGSRKGRDSEQDARFFRESLLDFLAQNERSVPELLASGEKLPVRRGVHGKPYFDAPGLSDISFSISHTQGLIAVCFAFQVVGVDCENITARTAAPERYAAIARKCFTGAEQRYLADASLSQEGMTARFFEIWTAKEAYMKYTGNGFSEGFQSFSVCALPAEVRIKAGHFPDAPQVVYAICTQAAGTEESDGFSRDISRESI